MLRLSLAGRFGLNILSPLPSLFTFNTPEGVFKDLSGVSVSMLTSKLQGKTQTGWPLLVTHWGFYPAILKLSAWRQRMAEVEYKFSH
jgi:predicted flavoprotein YhiN